MSHNTYVNRRAAVATQQAPSPSSVIARLEGTPLFQNLDDAEARSIQLKERREQLAVARRDVFIGQGTSIAGTGVGALGACTMFAGVGLAMFVAPVAAILFPVGLVMACAGAGIEEGGQELVKRGEQVKSELWTYTELEPGWGKS